MNASPGGLRHRGIAVLKTRMRGQSSSKNRVDTGLAHLAAGNLEQAQACFEAVLRKSTDHPEALHGLACIARAQGNPGQAIAVIGAILKRVGLPEHCRARLHITLGYALSEAGHLEPARAALSVALLLQPQDLSARLGLGEMLLRQGKHLEGLQHWSCAVNEAVDKAPVHQRCGETLMALRLFDDAVPHFEAVVALSPEEGIAWANLGAALFECGRMEEAHSAHKKACARGGDTAMTRANRALTCLALGYFEQAEADMARARAARPEDRRIRNNAATLALQTGSHAIAETEFAALMQGHDDQAAQAAFNLATLWLSQGRMQEGWRLFESRHRVLQRSMSLPQWDGQVSQTPVRVEAEQGAGDFIQFIRYLPVALSRAPIILHADESLWSLVALSEALMLARQQGRLSFDGEASAQCAMMSLPLILGMTEPESQPYFTAPAFRETSQDKRHALRVGVCWSGSKRYRFDARRSIESTVLRDLFHIEDINFIALQKSSDVETWPDGLKAAAMQDWIATASELAQCDLVISVDTAVAHLAGALGRPLWLLNRFGGDWRWDGPKWYADVTVFQAKRAESPSQSWVPVIEIVRKKLKELARQKTISAC